MYPDKTAYYYVIMSNGTTDIALFTISFLWTYNKNNKGAHPIAWSFFKEFTGFKNQPF